MVVIIIGILAAIAIPVFLSQRDNADQAAAKSDLRNGAAAATACSADNDGDYSTCTLELLNSTYGWKHTDGLDAPTVTPSPDKWVATQVAADSADTSYTFDTDVGRVTETP